MQLKLVGRKVSFLSDKIIGYYKDNLYDTLTCNVDTDSEWSYVLDVVGKPSDCCQATFSNIINLSRDGDNVFVTFEEGMLPEGKVSLQFRGTKGDQVYVSEIFDIWCKMCLNPSGAYDPIPSEFTQIEQRIQEYNNHPPYPDSASGYWMIWNVDTHQYEQSTLPIGAQLPSIDATTVGKYLSNDGSNAQWVNVPTIPEISEATVGKVLSNDGSQAQWIDSEGNVSSVNGKTGEVVLNAQDVGALPEGVEVVRYTAQELNEEQQAQARENIGAGTSDFDGDYNNLTNQPFIPNSTSDLTNDSGYITADEAPVQSVNGKTGDVEVIEDKNFVFTQSTATRLWYIVHNLDKYPSVVVVDTGGNTVIGDVEYIDTNIITVSFNAAFSGYAYLN